MDDWDGGTWEGGKGNLGLAEVGRASKAEGADGWVDRKRSLLLSAEM